MSAFAKGEGLLTQLLFGLESALSQSKVEFRNIVDAKYENIKDLNDKKIQLKCSEVQRNLEVYIYSNTPFLYMPSI